MEDFSLMEENDSLISPHASSSSSSPTTHHQSSEESPDNGKVVPHRLLERSEAEAEGGDKKRSGKCNLRKSLAWDTAFFHNPGVLDAEELCTMIQGAADKGKRQQLLPGIQEDISRSTDSISTLEVDLFDDIRASIQKSTSLSNPKAASPHTHKPPVKKVELTSRNRIATGAATTKQPCGIQGSGKLIKQGVTCPQVKQLAVKNVNSTSSVCQPTKVISKARTVSTVTNKRASSGATRVKAESHDAKFSKGIQLPKPTGLLLTQRAVPKPTLSSKSVGATKIEAVRSSSSSTSNSTLSDKKEKPPVISARRKIESRPVIKASSNSIPKASSKVPLRKKPSDSSSLSTSLASKISSSISPASSISEWSSASSSTSTVNQRSKSRASIDTSSSCRSLDSDSLPGLCSDVQFNAYVQDGIVNQLTGLPSQDVKRTSMQTGLLSGSALMKPSGLRVPSPKIGFFDGAKSVVRTPSGGAQSKPHSRLPTGLPKIGAGIGSPVGSSMKARDGKLPIGIKTSAILDGLQSASLKPFQESLRAAKKTPLATRGMKSPTKSSKVQDDTHSTSAVLDSLQSASTKPFQESLRASKKTPLAIRGMKSPISNDKFTSPKPVQDALSALSGISPEVHNEKGGISCLKAEEGVGIGKPDAADAEHTTVKPQEAENNEIQVALKGSASLFKLENAEFEEIKVAFTTVDTSEPSNANHIDYLKPLDEMGEDTVNGDHQCNDALISTTNVNQIIPLRNVTDGLSRDIKAVVRQVEMQKELTEGLNSQSEVCNILDCDALAELSLKKRLPSQNEYEAVHVNDLLMSATRTPLAAEDSLCNIEAIVVKNETQIDVKGNVNLFEQGNSEVGKIKVSPAKMDISGPSKDNCLEYLKPLHETVEDEVCGEHNWNDSLLGTKNVKQIVSPTNQVDGLSRDIKAVDTQVEMQIEVTDSLSSTSSKKHHLNQSEVVPVSSLFSFATRTPLVAKDSLCNIEAIELPEVSEVTEKTNTLHSSENIQTPEQKQLNIERVEEKCPLNSV